MAPTDAAGPGPDALWLAAQAARRPSAMANAQTLVAAWGRSNDGALHARQYLERDLGADPERVFTAADYRYAADGLHGLGQQGHGEVLEAIAAADAELHGLARGWLHRYDRRPPTAGERSSLAELASGQVTERSRAGLGIDGAWYAPAAYPRTGQPAVVVTTSAGTRLVVPFDSAQASAAWLDSRSPEAAGPLATTANGPVTRTGREEELLAWLLRQPGDAQQMLSQLSPRAWTAHLRAELARALAWATERGGVPEYAVIGQAYARRLLRAPGIAAAEIGWPHMTRAMTYMQRLTETPVTRRQAAASAGWLARADAEAAEFAKGPGRAPAVHTHPAARAREAVPAQDAGPRLMQPPPPVPGPGGPAQRM